MKSAYVPKKAASPAFERAMRLVDDGMASIVADIAATTPRGPAKPPRAGRKIQRQPAHAA